MWMRPTACGAERGRWQGRGRRVAGGLLLPWNGPVGRWGRGGGSGALLQVGVGAKSRGGCRLRQVTGHQQLHHSMGMLSCTICFGARRSLVEAQAGCVAEVRGPAPPLPYVRQE